MGTEETLWEDVIAERTSVTTSNGSIVPERYLGFEMIKESIEYDADWDAIVLDRLGEDYIVADWAHLKTAYEQLSGSEWRNLVLHLWPTIGDNSFVYPSGAEDPTSSLAYFVSRHDGDVPGGWAVFGDINNMNSV